MNEKIVDFDPVTSRINGSISEFKACFEGCSSSGCAGMITLLIYISPNAAPLNQQQFSIGLFFTVPAPTLTRCRPKTALSKSTLSVQSQHNVQMFILGILRIRLWQKFLQAFFSNKIPIFLVETNSSCFIRHLNLYQRKNENVI